ncbi:uncharacterized protein [Choristoneura fumiferana]|uniref:Uncharacterized protein n=1 Tax=Picea sitchensis TaxID=3332 RepID=C0PPX5_PICSI|nr:unknown [Picea sitchensis]
MKWGFACVLLLQLSSQCCSRTLPDSEESVVSVYTTQPSSGPSKAGDVYHQIANNIAERITSPIYRFLGFGKNKTEPATKSTKKPWDKIESFDEPEDVTRPDLKPVANGIEDRDIEELSVEALKKNDKKPEKLTLYSNYLPSSKIEFNNDTVNEIDDPFEFDDDDDDAINTPREGGFVYFLELIGSFIQLAFGAFLALFKPSTN